MVNKNRGEPIFLEAFKRRNIILDLELRLRILVPDISKPSILTMGEGEMKRLLVLLMCLALLTAFVVSCGEKEGAETDAAAGQPEEMADTTRMDSAMMEEGMEMADSAGEAMMEKADSAGEALMEEAGEAAEGGH